MRISITFSHLKNVVLPINYQYLISSWIYNTINKSDSDFAAWLHEKGYTLTGKNYKLFTFSKLNPARYGINERAKTFALQEGPTTLYLSFMVDGGAQHFITGLFKNQIVQLKSGQFSAVLNTTNVEVLPEPKFQETARYKCITPCFLSIGKDGEKYSKYLKPDLDEEYAAAFAENLVNKANSYLNEFKYSPSDVTWKLLPDWKVIKKKYTIKGIDSIGYHHAFELKAPVELHQIGYFGGFGGQTASLGMGMAEMI